jgi:hypothetical protein
MVINMQVGSNVTGAVCPQRKYVSKVDKDFDGDKCNRKRRPKLDYKYLGSTVTILAEQNRKWVQLLSMGRVEFMTVGPKFLGPAVHFRIDILFVHHGILTWAMCH